eukprot:gene20589-25247_t
MAQEKKRNSSTKPKNIVGPQVRAAREERGLFQDELARRMRARGHPMGRLQVLKMEAGSRYVTDTELLSL